MNQRRDEMEISDQEDLRTFLSKLKILARPALKAFLRSVLGKQTEHSVAGDGEVLLAQITWLLAPKKMEHSRELGLSG